MSGVEDELAFIAGGGGGGRTSLGCFAEGGKGGGLAFAGVVDVFGGASLASYGEGLGFRWRGII